MWEHQDLTDSFTFSTLLSGLHDTTATLRSPASVTPTGHCHSRTRTHYESKLLLRAWGTTHQCVRAGEVSMSGSHMFMHMALMIIGIRMSGKFFSSTRSRRAALPAWGAALPWGPALPVKTEPAAALAPVTRQFDCWAPASHDLVSSSLPRHSSL